MSVIDSVISDQAFELIRNRIGEILIDEVANQFVLSADPLFKATVYVERFVPFDKTELPAINVMLSRGDLDNQSAIQSDGTYFFNIDCYSFAKTTTDKRGDSLAITKLHKLLGVCRAILEDPKYKTLGFTPPFVMNRHIVDIGIQNPAGQDASSVVMGRITLSVRVPENVALITPELIGGFDTQVKLGATDKGYIFSGNNIPVPELNYTIITANSTVILE